MKRILLGILISPMASGLLQALIMQDDRVIFIILFVGVYSYPITIFLALPIYMLYKKLDWLKYWHVAITGTGIGVILGIIMRASLGNLNVLTESMFTDYVAFGAHGLAVSSVFWIIVIMSKSSKKSFKSTPESGSI